MNRLLALSGLMLTAALVWAGGPLTTNPVPEPPPPLIAPPPVPSTAPREPMPPSLAPSPVSSVSPTAPVPPPIPEREKPSWPEADDAAEAARLRVELAGLLARLKEKDARSAAAKVQPVPPRKDAPAAPVSTSQAGDMMKIAEESFSNGKIDDALRWLRRIDLESASKDDRILVQYLTAACHRAKNAFDEAAVLYRAVVESKGDEALVESAAWQLKAMEERRSLMRELADLRQR